MNTPTWNKDKRRAVWTALNKDDPDLLARWLISSQDVRDAYVGLWKPKKYRQGEGKRDTHLLEVLLLQKTGVNHGKGRAMRCYEWLLRAYPDAYSDEEKVACAGAECRSLVMPPLGAPGLSVLPPPGAPDHSVPPRPDKVELANKWAVEARSGRVEV